MSGNKVLQYSAVLSPKIRCLSKIAGAYSTSEWPSAVGWHLIYQIILLQSCMENKQNWKTVKQ